MRRQHEVDLERLGLDKSSRKYIVRCGAYKKRKEEHVVEVLGKYVIFHGHGSIMSPAALIQEARMMRVGEQLFGCAYLAQLLLHFLSSNELSMKRGNRRSKAMMDMDEAGIPRDFYPELARIADRRRDHSFEPARGKGQFGSVPLKPYPEYAKHRALWAIEERRKRDMDKLNRVLSRLEAQGVKLTKDYYTHQS